MARHGPKDDAGASATARSAAYLRPSLKYPPWSPSSVPEPLDLVHIDYVSMEVTVGVKEKPVVKNVLVVEDHFTCYTKAYVTNNHTACTDGTHLIQRVLLGVWVPPTIDV